MSDDIKRAVAAENKNGRKSVGAAGPSVSFPKGQGKSVRKGNAAADPLAIGAGTAVARPHTETMGAAYRVMQTFPKQTPESQSVMANARIIPATHRVGKGFWSQAAGL